MVSYPWMPIFYAFLACILLSILIKRKIKSTQPEKLPPGPPRLPLLGNLHQLGNPLHITLQRLATKYGDLMFLQLGSVPTIVISSGDMVREIFKTHDAAFSDRPQTYAINKLGYNCSTISFSPYGDHWRELRKIVMSELLSSKRVQSFRRIRDEEVNSMIDSIANSSNPVNLSELALALSNSVLCRLAFGKKLSCDCDGRNNLCEMLQEAEEFSASPCLSDFFPNMEWFNRLIGLEARLEKSFRDLDGIYSKVVEDHLDPSRPGLEQEDVVDALLRVFHHPDQSIGFNLDRVKGVIADLSVAGTDTSAATLEWTMSELIKNPSVLKKATEEVRRVTNGKCKVEEDDLTQLIYLKSVVKESLRLHPPVPLLLPRTTTEDCVIKGYKIAAKTRVIINATTMFRDPKIWEDPEEFRPERFLDNPIDFKGQHFEYIPFGVGRRSCPGMNFAVVLVELALANILGRFDWDLHGMTRDDLDMEGVCGVTIHKKTPLCLVASPVKF